MYLILLEEFDWDGVFDIVKGGFPMANVTIIEESTDPTFYFNIR